MTNEKKKSALEQLREELSQLLIDDVCNNSSKTQIPGILACIKELAERLEKLEAQRETDLKMVYDVIEAKLARLPKTNDVRQGSANAIELADELVRLVQTFGGKAFQTALHNCYGVDLTGDLRGCSLRIPSGMTSVVKTNDARTIELPNDTQWQRGLRNTITVDIDKPEDVDDAIQLLTFIRAKRGDQ